MRTVAFHLAERKKERRKEREKKAKLERKQNE